MAEQKTVELSHREQINSAIGTWSGFIYQGLCGILVALKMIKDNKEGTRDYKLQLDGYEDFIILDEREKIVSLHQCKSVKGRTDYDEDLKKMKQKRDGFDNLREDVKSYFHCNESVSIPDDLDIDNYLFKEGKTKCEPGEIKGVIKEVIELVKKPESNSDAVLARLESIVNANVLNTQQKYFGSNKQLNQIAREEYIPFREIQGICEESIIRLTPIDILTQIKTRYVQQFRLRIENEYAEKDMTHVEQVIRRIVDMDEQEMKDFMQRITPRKKFEYNQETIADFCSDDQINLFFNLIEEFPVNPQGIDWITRNSKQTPTTLSDTQNIKTTCRQIYENRANLDAMWIYDWLVGKIDGESVLDIAVVGAPVTTVEREDAEEKKNIFKEKKVGIMNLNDKRNGTYN
jgi:hypothetical protein